MVPKINLSFLAIGAFLFACGNKHRNELTSKTDSLSPTNKSEQQKRKKDQSNNDDTLFKDSNAYVLGNRFDAGDSAISYVGIKFKPHIRFSDFPGKTTSNQIKAPIKRSSNPLAREFRTAINTAYAKGVNFGGHYTFVEWGCGNPCQMSVVIDVNTGIVYDGVDGPLGYDFRKNSRMLIVNPPGSDGFYPNCDYCVPLIYIWDEKNKKFDKR